MVESNNLERGLQYLLNRDGFVGFAFQRSDWRKRLVMITVSSRDYISKHGQLASWLQVARTACNSASVSFGVNTV